jgi:hypothetical protein
MHLVSPPIVVAIWNSAFWERIVIYRLIIKKLNVPCVNDDAARPRRRGDRMGAPAASWCDPAGVSPAQVRVSVRLVASVAWPLATAVAKRTQQLHGVWD